MGYHSQKNASFGGANRWRGGLDSPGDPSETCCEPHPTIYFIYTRSCSFKTEIRVIPILQVAKVRSERLANQIMITQQAVTKSGVEPRPVQF